MYVSLDNERQKIIFTNKCLKSKTYMMTKQKKTYSMVEYFIISGIQKFSVSYSEFSIKQGIKKKLLIMRNPIR